MLLYLDADNKNDGVQLLEDYRRSLAQLKTLNHACVRVAAQVDGPASIGTEISDTQRLLIDFNANGSLPSSTTQSIAEQAMDDPITLRDFIKWGQEQLPADHYYLAISDHGNAYQGIAFDHTSDSSGNAYLTAGELGDAITAPGVLPIDIVHLDACSMALFDVAYELRDQVDYLIASQYIGWSFFAYGDYASYIDQWTEPEQLATLIVERYGNLAERERLPYTLSALRLARISPLKTAIDNLAMWLKAWVGIEGAAGNRHDRLFNEIRNDRKVVDGVTSYHGLFFDSNANYLNTPRDAYLDLKDLMERVKQANLTSDITAAATLVLAEFGRPDGLILDKRYGSGQLPARYAKGIQIDIVNPSGISLYYPAEGDAFLSLPPDPVLSEMGVQASAAEVEPSVELTYTLSYSRYITNQLFDHTRSSRWDEFLVAAYGTPPASVILATPPPPLAPAAAATPTGTPTPTSSLTPSPTETPTGTPLPTPTPTPTATTAAPFDPMLVLLQSNHKLNDVNGDGPSADEVVHFDITITNQSDAKMMNVVLAQLMQPSVDGAVAVTRAPCLEIASADACITIGDIDPKTPSSKAFDVKLSSNAPLSPQTVLFVNGVRQPYTSVMAKFYLPITMR
jgi:hypothetical protein